VFRTRSIQFKLTVWYACALAVALALFSAAIFIALRQQLMRSLDSDLVDSAARFQSYFLHQAELESGNHLKGELVEFCEALPETSYVELRGASGFEFHYPERRSAPHHQRRVQKYFTSGNESFHLSVSASAESIYRAMDLLRLLLAGLAPALIVAACVGGVLLSRRALAPVAEVTSAARMIGVENLSQRLPVPRTGDELQRLTEVWNSMLDRLDTAVKALSQFAEDASHELRTPLAVIRTGAELALRRARSPESYRESLSAIAAEAERMTRMIDDLLFLARSGASADRMPMRALNPAEVVRAVLTELRQLAAARNIEVRANSTEDAPLISGNEPALRRLVLALIENAIKYSKEGGLVIVTVSGAAERVRIAVEDFGIGISPADLPHIFRRFYRADAARGESGYGLGLSLASTIAQLHGATIDASSRTGEGSLFTVEFPTREALVAA
jgi:signal transduction histidine kinase